MLWLEPEIVSEPAPDDEEADDDGGTTDDDDKAGVERRLLLSLPGGVHVEAAMAIWRQSRCTRE